MDLEVAELRYSGTGSGITDISALANLTNLQSLEIREYGEAKISDWSPVAHVPNLTKS